MMAGIGGKNTEPERTVRSYLHRQGLRFRLHKPGIPGRPDVVLPRYRAVVFVHGCFWHRHVNCRFAYTPKSNRTFWSRKFRENVDRDRRTLSRLRNAGWHVFVIWECSLSENRLESLVRRIKSEERSREGKLSTRKRRRNARRVA